LNCFSDVFLPRVCEAIKYMSNVNASSSFSSFF
jgi:hypothetical protein